MKKKVLIEVSARHVHLSQEDLEKLFGKNHELRNIKKLSQSDDFASSDIIEIVHGDKKLKARVLGPIRRETQVEISITDAHELKLGKIPPVRVSGDLSGADEILIKGRKGNVKGKVIIAKRHLHASEEDAHRLGLRQNQIVKIKVDGNRGLIFDNVVVRIKKDFKLALHLDTDEGNAGGIKGKDYGELLR